MKDEYDLSEAEQGKFHIPAEDIPTEIPRKGVKIGGLAGQGYAIPDDFNEPLDDLSEYV